MAQIDVDDVAYAAVTDVVGFFKFLFDNKLETGAIAHLEGLGVVDIAISQQAVTAVKDFIANELGSDESMKEKVQQVVQCACCNAGCRNK